ncbi:hypothetical protein [Pseudacidovorax sp. RU35E]|uniref:hypothetical protein n=1 Tax=Pseudacidovorax sp. RU35E TaxID=1907403 RepID=UPI0013565CD2|nr:hypothetical protein [Pseudacidovorax sp. RU35E]
MMLNSFEWGGRWRQLRRPSPVGGTDLRRDGMNFRPADPALNRSALKTSFKFFE